MHRRLAITHGAWQVLLAAIVALALVMGAMSASAASSRACSVKNTATGKTFGRLQAAVDAASKDDSLTVRGTCHGTVVIDKSVLIEGIGAASRPLLAGDRAGVVLTVRKGVTATVKDLAIEGGRGHFRRGGPEKRSKWPAGVLNNGNLTLRSVIVKGNHGVGIENTGRLRLNGNAIVRENGLASVNEYTGIHNTGTLRMNGSASVRWDDVMNDGILVMNGASLSMYLDNRGTATLKGTSSARQVWNSGTLTLMDTSRIAGLEPHGGYATYLGVSNRGTLTLNDTSRISDYVRGVVNFGSMTLNDSSHISHNGDFSEVGSAVSNSGTLTLNGTSHISHNWQGVANSGSVTLNGSSAIRDNHSTQYRSDCPAFCPRPPRLVGGGVSNAGSLTLNDASSISGNSAAESGGGVFMVNTAASLTMTGSSTISGNTTGQSGGGLYAGPGTTLVGVSCGPQTLANVYGNTPDDCYFEP